MIGVARMWKAVRRRAGDTLAFLLYVVRRFDRDGAAGVAASLSYTSLLGLVPLLAMALAMLAAFPVFDEVRAELQKLAFSTFAPHVGDAVQEQVANFVGNAGRLTAAGIVGLAVTAVLLLVTIESSLNVIFRVTRDRPIIARLLVYWTVLTLGPLLVGASLSLQGYVYAVRTWMGVDDLGHLSAAAARILPMVMTTVAFGLLYLAVPNRPVRLWHAAVGGVAAGLLFAGLRWAFGFYVATLGGYRTVYGAVSAVPIFLVWMYLSWAVVLIGAEVTAALPEWRLGRRDPGELPASRRTLAMALEVLSILHRAAQRGSGGVSRATMLDHTAAAERHLNLVLRLLCDAGMAAPTLGSRYLLSRDLETVTLYDLVLALGLGLSLDATPGAASEWRGPVGERIATADGDMRAVLGVDLKSLLGAVRTGQAQGAPQPIPTLPRTS